MGWPTRDLIGTCCIVNVLAEPVLQVLLDEAEAVADTLSLPGLFMYLGGFIDMCSAQEHIVDSMSPGDATTSLGVKSLTKGC